MVSEITPMFISQCEALTLFIELVAYLKKNRSSIEVYLLITQHLPVR